MSELETADRDLWRGFRRAYEQASMAVEHELRAATQLSAADHGILSRLAAVGPEGMRQQELANAMRWDRTRLSHHLSRMESRGLVRRTRRGKGATFLTATATGNRAREAADPVHAEAVRKHFLSKLSMEQRKALEGLAAAFPPST